MLAILAICQSGRSHLLSSDVLLFEIEHNPNPVRREFAIESLSVAKLTMAVSDPLEKRAAELTAAGFKPLDALHLASAEAAQADYFCTCDDRLLKRAKVDSSLKVRVVSPVVAIEEIDA